LHAGAAGLNLIWKPERAMPKYERRPEVIDALTPSPSNTA